MHTTNELEFVLDSGAGSVRRLVGPRPPALVSLLSRRARVALAALVVVGVGGGCASETPRRPVEELFKEALDASRVREGPAQVAARAATAANRRLSAEAAPLAEKYGRLFSVAPKERGTPVSDVFLDSDVQEAIRSLANQAHVTVVIDTLVRGSTSAVLEKVPFETALETILLPLGYVFRRRGNEYLVGTPAPDSSLFPAIAETLEFRPEHLTTSELVELLPASTKPFLRVSSSRNLIVVHAPREIAKRILRDLDRLDQSVPQVLLEAIVCVYAPEQRFEFGFDLQQGFPRDGEFANVGLADLALTGMLGPAGMEGLNSFRFTSALIRALDSEGYVSIRAAPRVMVQDGERAVITIGEETYFTFGDGQNLFRDLKPVQSGIVLDVVPRVHGSEVTIRIERAEVSDEIRPSKIVSASSDDQLPTLKTRRVSTTVHLRDGETTVIGGLVQHRAVSRVVKVPLLSAIPLLGRLFERVDEQSEEAEVAIFLSPRIVWR